MEKKPFLTESMAQDIIQDVPTPFHVYDEKGIRENARRITKAFHIDRCRGANILDGVACGATGLMPHGNPTLVSSVFDATLYGMLMENPNIQLLMNTSCMDAEVKDRKIVSVSGRQQTP